MLLKNFMSEHCPTSQFQNFFLTGTGFEKVAEDTPGHLSDPHERIPPTQKIEVMVSPPKPKIKLGV
jgi:hypothetical protein